jgi:2,3-bisphosphoglycerate-independent phosphoglycerate mutase
MKYLILVPDGAGDDPIEMLGGKTPLEVASLPVMNRLASMGEVGTVATIPEGVPPGSDAANLSVMGYDPSIYLTGRSPLEAVSIGIDMSETDVAFRTNLVTLDGEGVYDDLIIKDHASGDITTEEADQLIQAVNQAFADHAIQFYTGTSFRHCMIVHDGEIGQELTPPHDVLGRRAGDYLPKGPGSEIIDDMMRKSYEILNHHPVNEARRAKGLNPANSLWIWGQGKKPALSSFQEKYGITGSAISAVDLIKGIALCAGLHAVDVEGATGTLHTNYEGKAKAAVERFRAGDDFIYLHVEGPDECSHQGNLEEKIQCLEEIDQRVLKPIWEYLESQEEPYRILALPDHKTPLRIRTHSSEPVPFVLFDSTKKKESQPENEFNEVSGANGTVFHSGHQLADYFFQG